MSVNIAKQVWTCHACGVGGSVLDYLAKAEGIPVGDVLNRLGGTDPAPIERRKKDKLNWDDTSTEPAETKPTPSSKNIKTTYDYVDQLGNLVYQVCRIETPNKDKPCGYDKTFRQRRPDGKGGWVWSMEGVELVLYRLPEILNPKNKYVWIVEGEKDVETIREIGLAATTNVGGAGKGKWHDAYSECLKNKEVVLCGDNDDVGRKHISEVMESLEPFASSIRKIEVPSPAKDITEFRESFKTKEEFISAIMALIDSAPIMMRGGALPIRNSAEMEQEYIDHIKAARISAVDFSKWIPSLNCVRALVPGELVSIVGDTGSSKTFCLQHIALSCRVPTLLFELELPNAMTFERFMSISLKKSGYEIHTTYNSDQRLDHSAFSHIYTCGKSRLTPKQIESLILKSELKIGVRPTMVMVDYVQLVQGEGKSRYERASSVAEELKIIAKNTGTVIVMASQVARDRTTNEIGLHDAKESGSIENSSGLVLGIWRDDEKKDVLIMKILKNTKGESGKIIRCRIDTSCMNIVELSPIDEADIPPAKSRNYDRD